MQVKQGPEGARRRQYEITPALCTVQGMCGNELHVRTKHGGESYTCRDCVIFEQILNTPIGQKLCCAYPECMLSLKLDGSPQIS